MDETVVRGDEELHFVLVFHFHFIRFQVNKTSDGLVQEIERNLSNFRKTTETKNAEVSYQRQPITPNVNHNHLLNFTCLSPAIINGIIINHHY